MYYDNLARTWSSERFIHPVVVEDKEFSCDIHTPDTSSHNVDEQPDFFIAQGLTDSVDHDQDCDTVSPDSIPADVEDSEVISITWLF